jgi:hypothetical protein
MQPPHCRIIALLLVLSSVAHVKADPFAEMSGFSHFQNIDPAKLTKPMAVRWPPDLENARDLSVQCCYIVQAPLQKTAEIDAHWDVMRHPELKVYMHTDLRDKPGLADFERIAQAPANSAVSSFAAATEKLNPDQPQLQMSKEEAKLFAKPAAASSKGRMSDAVAKFWSNLLYQRTQRYLSGGLGALPAYAGSETIRASAEAARLLKEQPKIRDQFRALIADTPLGGGSSRPALYWELFDVEGQAAACLGASYKKAVGDSRQGVDIQYYASGGYYVLLTFQQMWPITFNGKPATLAWRGDMLSSSNLANLHGVERIGSGMAMMRTVQKAAAAFQKDVVANP